MLIRGYQMKFHFFDSPILEARAEILKKNRWLFEKFEDAKIPFWHLLTFKEQLNSKNQHGRTGFHLACYLGRHEVVSHLLKEADTKGGLITESFSLFLKSPKKGCQITIRIAIHLKRRCSGSCFGNFFLDIWAKVKNCLTLSHL